MAQIKQWRRGTAAENNNFTGAPGEITVDTTTNTLRVHDGQTLGGTALARADSVTDMTGTDYVVAWQSPTADNDYTWYRKYRSGWVEMGGNLSGKSITFPIAFMQTPTLILSTKSNVTTAVYQNTYSTLTKTGFSGWKMGVNAGWIGEANEWNGGCWMAYGISA